MSVITVSIVWWISVDFNDDLFLNSSGGTTLMRTLKSINSYEALFAGLWEDFTVRVHILCLV